LPSACVRRILKRRVVIIVAILTEVALLLRPVLRPNAGEGAIKQAHTLPASGSPVPLAALREIRTLAE
jgi:hypothetical protein